MRTAVAVALLAAFGTPVTSGGAAAQEREPEPTAVQEAITVERVLLDVRVVGRDNRAVAGLGRGDFQVTVDGHAVDVASVDWIDGLQVQEPTPDSSRPALPASGTAGVREPGEKGLTVLFFQRDLEALRVTGLMRALPEARRLVAALQDGDRMAVLAHDTRLHLLADVDSDRERLAALLTDGSTLFAAGWDDARTGAGAPPAASGDGAPASRDGAPASGDGARASRDGAPASGDGARVRGDGAPVHGDSAPASGDREAASGDSAPASGDREAASGDSAPASGDREAASGDRVPARGDRVPTTGPLLADTLTAPVLARAAQVETALLRLGEALERLPGPKDIVFFAWGMGRFGRDGVSERADYRPAIAALRRARASLLTIDVAQADRHSLEQPLRTAAHETGGVFVKNYPTTGAVAVIRAAAAGRYVLALRPPVAPPVAPEARVRVRLTGRRDVTVYYPERIAPRDPRPAEERSR